MPAMIAPQSPRNGLGKCRLTMRLLHSCSPKGVET